MTARIHHLLQRLYPVKLADETYIQLLTRMTAVLLEARPHPGAERFSEQDVVLISYGDSVAHHGEAPLRTLRRFAEMRLKGLISTIHILPFFPYTSDDGFSVLDFYQVNPALGDWRDIEGMGRNFTLMFDAVFNHMSAQSDWFRAFLVGDPAFAGLFMAVSPKSDLTQVTRPRVSPLLTPFQRADGETIYVWTTFSPDQVDFDLRQPQTLLRLLDILLFYVERGASLIRLDAIAYLWKTPGTPCIHLEQTHVIIQLMRAVLDEVAPQVALITETNVPHAENISYWGDGHNEAQMVYNFALPPLLVHSLLSGDVTKLAQWATSLRTPSPQATFFNFTASHDGIGLRPVEEILTPDEVQALVDHTLRRGGRVSYRDKADGGRSAYELNISYVDAVIYPDEAPPMQVGRFLLTQGIMLALAGVPGIYIHSLLGSQNNLTGLQQTGQNRTINRARLDFAGLEAELSDPDSLRHQVFESYRALLVIRRAQPAFHPNAPQAVLDSGSRAVFALRRGAADEKILALFNVSGQTQEVHLPYKGQDLLSGQRHADRFVLAAYQMLWLKIDAASCS